MGKEGNPVFGLLTGAGKLVDAEKLQEYRERLLAAREAAMATWSRFTNEAPEKWAIGELSSYDNHPADLASETFERGKDLALRDHTALQIRQIDEALRRIDAGTYGLCVRCGGQIPEERLEAIPETPYCLQCRYRFDKEDSFASRPIEELTLYPPFGRRKRASDIEYGGEDVWQELAHYAEHAPQAGSGAYYGYLGLKEDRGHTEDVDAIPYTVGDEGMFYEAHGDYYDEEWAPREDIEVGLEDGEE